MTFVVRETERAEAERDSAFLRILSLVGPEFAEAWHQAILAAIAGISEFPGPFSNAKDEEASARYGYVVRRLLYSGPTRRKSAVAYRVLYTVLPPDNDGIATILVLRILHAAHLLDSPAD